MRTGGQVGNFCFSYIGCEGLVDVGDAVFDVLGIALGEHLDRAVVEVADKPGELVTVGDSVCGEAKAHTLNAADEDYLFGNHCLAHCISYVVLRGRADPGTQRNMVTENFCGFKTILTRCNLCRRAD